MFGEYNDLDICGVNRGGGFDDPSDDTNYSFDVQSDAGASISDDYIDTFDSNLNEQEQPQIVQNGPQNIGPEQQMGTKEQEPPKKNSGSVYVLALLLIVVIVAGLFYYKKTVSEDMSGVSNQEMGDYFYDKATENMPDLQANEQNPEAQAQPTANESQPLTADTMATIDVDLANPQTQASNAPQIQKSSEKSKVEPAETKKALTSVVIPVSSGGRLDPFAPFNETYKKPTANIPKFDIVAPPLEIPDEDPMIDKLMEVKITGIMYDNVRPSALIVVDGNDQLVHKGDLVSDYKILDITRNKVVMKYKTNIYEVSTGQTITTDGVNLNPVSSSALSKQFGGAYSKSTGNVINFN